MEEADLAGARDMRAAAQLARAEARGGMRMRSPLFLHELRGVITADRHDAHDIAVLLTEERRRAQAHGLVPAHFGGRHIAVGANPGIDAVLDLAQLDGLNRARMA